MEPVRRRRHVRVPVDVPVVLHDGGSAKETAHARDVSLSGLKLQSTDTIRLGSRIHLEFVLPNEAEYPVMAIGRVVWGSMAEAGSPRSFGVEIVRYFPSAKLAVHAFVDRHRRRQLNYNLFDER